MNILSTFGNSGSTMLTKGCNTAVGIFTTADSCFNQINEWLEEKDSTDEQTKDKRLAAKVFEKEQELLQDITYTNAQISNLLGTDQKLSVEEQMEQNSQKMKSIFNKLIEVTK